MQYAVHVRRLPRLTRLDTRALKMDLFVDGNIAQQRVPCGSSHVSWVWTHGLFIPPSPRKAPTLFLSRVLPCSVLVLPLPSMEGHSTMSSVRLGQSFHSACGLRESLWTPNATPTHRSICPCTLSTMIARPSVCPCSKL